MTPDYYRTTDASDLYDLWRQHYGTETACRHLEMSAQEYLYRAPEKGSYLADLAKVQVIVQRLLAWGESPEGQAESQACDTREPLLTREQLLWQLQEEGYGLVRPADPTQPDPPQPAIVSHAEIKQRMAQAIDHRDEALAARNGTHAPWTTTPTSSDDVLETVLEHCMATDRIRQGVAVATEIRALLTHYRIPADSPYGDWSSELAKHEPQRWPDTTAQEGTGGHAGARTYSER